MSAVGEDEYQFADSIAEAELLLAFAAERGVPIPPGDIDAILAIVRGPNGQPPAAGTESAFWAAFARLAKAVSPATVQSLKATNKNVGVRTFLVGPKKSLPLPQEAVRRYRLWALGAVVTLLLVQTYAFVGTAILQSVMPLSERRDALEAERVVKQEELTSRNVAAATDPDFLRIDGQLRTTKQDLTATFVILNGWNRIWQSVLSMTGPRRIVHRLIGLFSPSSASVPEGDALPQSPDINVSNISDGRLAIFAADVALRSVQSFLLPLLFGWLGACAFILRRLSAEISNVTYSSVSEAAYRLRMPLGALAGMAIAWFVVLPTAPIARTTPALPPSTAPAKDAHGNAIAVATKTSETGMGADAAPPSTTGIPLLRTLSAAALAFLAGYSVELLFAMMDAIIGAFANPSART
jgi:hypothetical protein